MPKKSNNNTESYHDNRRKECYRSSNIWFKGFKNGVPESATDHYNTNLSEREVEKNFIFIFYLYGDFILHRENSRKTIKSFFTCLL